MFIHLHDIHRHFNTFHSTQHKKYIINEIRRGIEEEGGEGG